MDPVYHVTDIINEGGRFTATVELNPSHPVFAGHFPGQPVLPGVFMVEIVSSLAARLTGVEGAVTEIQAMKFLKMIDPRVVRTLTATGRIMDDEDAFRVEVNIMSAEDIFIRIKGVKICRK